MQHNLKKSMGDPAGHRMGKLNDTLLMEHAHYHWTGCNGNVKHLYNG